jgi:hypothetical protein
MLWRLYYEDGSTYDNVDGPAHEAPIRGLICIAQPYAKPDWYTVLTNGDWYIYWENRGYWTGHDLCGTLAQLESHAHNITAVRQGVYVTKPVFEELWRRAREDTDGEVSRG